MTRTIGSLFAGIGGFDLGFERVNVAEWIANNLVRVYTAAT